MEGSENSFVSKSSSDGKRMKEVYVSYYLNMLQNIPGDIDYFVSLNPHSLPKENLIHGKYSMAHPQYTTKSVRARDELLKKYQGLDGLWFCGAWSGYGFHEDGCRSGFDVATSISEEALPWSKDSKTLLQPINKKLRASSLSRLFSFFTHTMPVAICKRLIHSFLSNAIRKGVLELVGNDGSTIKFGKDNGDEKVALRVFDEWFYVKVALEYDLGMARAYMAGMFNVCAPVKATARDPILYKPNSLDESNVTIGDPVGLTRLFLLFIENRDDSAFPTASARYFKGPFSTASGLLIAKLGALYNFYKYKIFMNNTENGGSIKNISAHYDLSNEFFQSFLDKGTMTYSSAIYDTPPVSNQSAEGRMLTGTLEDAQYRKLDTLLSRAGICDYKGKERLNVLDIGFGWGGLSIRAAQKYNCNVVGITLSKEQMAYAKEKVSRLNLDNSVSYEIIDYRTFARRKENYRKFDVVLSCEMIEAVGHDHIGEFFAAVEMVLKKKGVLVMEAITTPEYRYESYRRSADLINTIIFPGSCCPSLHRLVDASYQSSTLTLNHITNINLHYAETLREWRRRFNAHSHWLKQSLQVDDILIRAWNYYLTYCEAGFYSKTENCLILKFSRMDGI